MHLGCTSKRWNVAHFCLEADVQLGSFDILLLPGTRRHVCNWVEIQMLSLPGRLRVLRHEFLGQIS